ELAGFGAGQTHAENAFARGIDQHFHEAVRLVDLDRAGDRRKRYARDLAGDAASARFAFAQTDAGDLRIDEHRVRDQARALRTRATEQAREQAAVIVPGAMGELRGRGRVAEREHSLGASFVVALHGNISGLVELHTASFATEVIRVGAPPGRD